MNLACLWTWRYKTKHEERLCVSILENLLRSASLWSHPRLVNLNETWNNSSPGFFLQILNSIFAIIDMGVRHKLLLQLFLIGFCLFCSKTGKNNQRDFHTLPGNPQQIFAYSWYNFKSFIKSFFSNWKYH